MSTFTFSMQPASKFNWADDDEEDDFDLEAWKATADVSAPTAESLPPLQIPETASSGSSYYTTISSSLPNETAPWATSAPPPTPSPAAAVPAIFPAQDRYHGYNAIYARRAVDDRPDPPAYPEFSAWGNFRQYYAREWSYMKVRSEADCRFPVQYRFGPLREVWNASDDEEAVDLVSAEPLVVGAEVTAEVAVVEAEEIEGFEEILEPFPDYQELEVVTASELSHDEELEPLHVLEDTEHGIPNDVASPTTVTDIQVPIEGKELVSPTTTDAAFMNIENDASTNELPPADLTSDIQDAFLSDSDSDTKSDSGSAVSSISSISLPCQTLTVTFPPEVHEKQRLASTPLSSPRSSPPLSPVYDATQIGLHPASEFIKKQQAHKRHDSQEALDHSKKHVWKLDDGIDIDDVELYDGDLELRLPHKQEAEYEEEVVMMHNRDKVFEGRDYLSNVSWRVTAAVIGLGLVLGGVLCTTRRR